MVPADKKPARLAQYFNNVEINTEIIFTFETTIRLNQTLCTKFSGTKNPNSPRCRAIASRGLMQVLLKYFLILLIPENKLFHEPELQVS